MISGKTISEIADRIVTYGTPAFFFVKEMLGKFTKNPEITKIVSESLVKVAKGGRTRSDELLFIASLVSLSGADATLSNKELFLQKHYELCEPDLVGKSPEEIKELRRKEKLAKGLIFLIAEDKTANDKKDPFRFANQVWYGIFLGIKDLPNDNTKLQVLEDRILHFGKNHQERITLSEVVEKIKPLWGKIEPALDKINTVSENYRCSSETELESFQKRHWLKKLFLN